MFLLNFLRLFTGYVRFRACGGFGERFINLCSQNSIILWNVRMQNDVIYASASVESYKRIRSCLKKSGMTAKIIKKAGLPFLLFRYRKRIGIPIGIAVFVLSISILSTRVWLINIEGNQHIPEETVISALEESGLYVGCPARSDPVRISLSAGNMIDGISEISVSIKGSSADVKIKEREPSPEIADSSGMYNLVASADAQLTVLEPYCGTPLAKTMNTVLKGEVLISGIVKNRDESTSYVHASGYAVGRTEKIIEVGVGQNEKFRKNESVGRKYSLFFLGVEIPLGKSEKNYDLAFKKEKMLSYSDKKMPFGIFRTEYSSFIDSTEPLTEKQKELICIERYLETARKHTGSRQLISETSEENFGGENKTIKGKFTCYENIGIEQEFSIEEGSPPN